MSPPPPGSAVEPTFTAVIPAYNAAATLRAAIESVLSQSRADFELIVVDDGSTDETLAIARSFESDPRVTVVHQANRGLPGARNTGIARAKAGYVSFLDSDDLLDARRAVATRESVVSPSSGLRWGRLLR